MGTIEILNQKIYNGIVRIKVPSMPFKPMKLKAYLEWIHRYGWSLKKGGIDHKLYDQEGLYITQIKILHPGNDGVHPHSVRKTQRELQRAGLE